ncbi:MAG: sugar ABC transporter permease [Sphaerochaeta sp.]|nr:sugar ABC transporter permease [Sphaerochaeta sp.]
MDKYFRNVKVAILFILPAMLVYTLMIFYPLTSSFFKSFTLWDGLSKAQFAGLYNYKKLLSDPILFTSLRNCFIFALMLIVIQVIGGTLLSFILVDKHIKGRVFFRKATFIPVLLSVVVASQLWVSILHGQYGLLNQLFEATGLAYRQDWLGQDPSAIILVSFVNAWQFLGLQLLIIYSAVRSVPEFYLEAASLEGATPFYSHMKITIPLIKDTLKVCLILAITSGFKAFENMYVMTGGGPAKATYSLTMMIFDAMFRVNKYGYGSAIAMFVLVLCLITTVVINNIAKERVEY